MSVQWHSAALFRWAAQLGFAKAALCPADGFADVRLAVESGPPIAERKQLRFDPAQDDPRTRSLAVLLWPYRPARIEGGDRVFVDSYYDASNSAYHAARELERRALEAGGFVRANAPYPAREAALRAGLGVIGQNGLLITPGFGTRTVIILLATDLPAPEPSGLQSAAASCARCGRCAAACPAGAIDGAGMSHPERCMRNFMMEGVTVPEHLRAKMGMRLIGCDICQRVCPMQPEFASDSHEAMSLSDFMTADERAFSQSVARLALRIGRNTARPQRVRAQAALLAGNLRDPAHLPALKAWADSPFDTVSEHARWAIARIHAARVKRQETGLDDKDK